MRRPAPVFVGLRMVMGHIRCLRVELTELGIFWLVRLLFSRLFRWARPLSGFGDILGFFGLVIDD
jgi:hypothetical protein